MKEEKKERDKHIEEKIKRVHQIIRDIQSDPETMGQVRKLTANK